MSAERWIIRKLCSELCGRFIIGIFEHLGRTLDLSFNLIKTIPDALEHLPTLRVVYFVQNRISTISNLDKATDLTSLELGGNRIRVRLTTCLHNLNHCIFTEN